MRLPSMGISATRSAFWGASGLLLAAAVGGCGGSDGKHGTACDTPGQVESCSCDDGATTGSMVCQDDGYWGDCNCETPYVGTGGSVGVGGNESSGVGGLPGAGGSMATGGMPAAGGMVGQGGSPGAGGAVAAGGMPGAGGAVGSGGAVGQGGTPGAGGLMGAGGAPASGGAPAAGGTDASGGAVGLGGAEAAGGTDATGGVAGSAGAGTGGDGTGGDGTGGDGTGGDGTGGAGGDPEWPQCYAGGVVPEDDAQLLQRAPASDYAEMHTHGGVAMLIGPDRPSCLTDQVITRDIQDLNQGIIDVVEILEFPAFPDWENGYYLNWVILNSGIPGATLSGEGGYQGDRWGHMNFESTQDCPCTWDNYNQGAALHECIHALQAELWAFNNPASGWIHEAHNCYLGTMREQLAHNDYTMGYGAAAALQMPHVPIESMGLLTDGTVAGPSDQLASGKTYVNSIVRYGLEIFFLSLNLEMGRGFVNCIWMDAAEDGNPATRTSSRKSVFQALQGYGGPEGAAHAVLSFGARSAILDYGDWTDVVRSTMQGNWNNNWWFYMYPSGDGTTTFSPPTDQIPHHQGRNIIPIALSSGATSVTVELTPDAQGSAGTPENMMGQLVYRTPDDQPVYGIAFSSGQSTIQVPNGARGGIVNFVVAVTNPNADSGSDDGSNKGFDGNEHFNYTARIVSGGTVAPTSTRPW